jgi:hypothetical protein
MEAVAHLLAVATRWWQQHSNFAYQVQVTILHGFFAGLIFRADNNGDFYYFQIGSNQFDELDSIQSGGSTVLTNANYNATIDSQGKSNTIAVVANGSAIVLFVNGQKIDSVTDSTFSQGYVGVAASTSTEAVFSNALVWTA